MRVSILLAFILGFVVLGCQKSAPPAPGTVKTEPAIASPAPPSPTVAPATPQGPRVAVTVTEDGWVPNRIPAKAGVPLTLAITRKTEKTCATEILFKGQEGKTDLPLNKTVEVVYTPKSSGDVKFGCAMGMMISGVIAVD